MREVEEINEELKEKCQGYESNISLAKICVVLERENMKY